MNIQAQLQAIFRAALTDVAGGELDAGRLTAEQLTELVEMVRPSQDPKFGDYQANCAMPLAKRLGKPPREVAAAIVERLNASADLAAICGPPEIAGPGFINLRLRDDWLTRQLSAAAGDSRLGIEPTPRPRKIIIDYSAPNVAKPMHVGHIRSTVIGDALYRVLKFLGHDVTSDNHIGDWGTQFGMIIYGVKRSELLATRPSGEPDSIADYGRIYEQVNRAKESDSEIGQAVLNETAKLHAGDPESKQLWEDIRARGLDEIELTYGRLGVSLDERLGESFYHDRLAGVVQTLVRREIARESEGAIGVFLDDNPEAPPFLVQKKDGAFLYATTDLATIEYRLERWHPDAILYVVDHRQSLHFEQLFKTARKWLGLENVELTHISFGTVLGEDGKPFKTRSGGTVGLSGLLDEAVARARAIVDANSPELSQEARNAVAEAVGIGAIKYADLSQNRTSDYVFSYDKMLAMNGNTATYMQYAYARVRSIFARGQSELGANSGAPLTPGPSPAKGRGEKNTGGVTVAATHAISLGSPTERALALEILRLAEALEAVASDYRPNHLTNYLFALAGRYSTFYEQCPVLKAETAELKRSRLALCDLTARTLRQGLALLGIEVVEKM